MSETPIVDEVTPAVEAGELTATETLAQYPEADLVIPPYSLDPAKTMRLIALVGDLGEFDRENMKMKASLGACADVFEWIAENAAKNKDAFNDAFRGRVPDGMTFAMAYAGAVGESNASAS